MGNEEPNSSSRQPYCPGSRPRRLPGMTDQIPKIKDQKSPTSAAIREADWLARSTAHPNHQGSRADRHIPKFFKLVAGILSFLVYWVFLNYSELFKLESYPKLIMRTCKIQNFTFFTIKCFDLILILHIKFLTMLFSQYNIESARHRLTNTLPETYLIHADLRVSRPTREQLLHEFLPEIDLWSLRVNSKHPRYLSFVTQMASKQ